MKRILVAVDFSEASVDALKQAITIAKNFEAKLLVLHVIHDPANSPGFYISKKADKVIRGGTCSVLVVRELQPKKNEEGNE